MKLVIRLLRLLALLAAFFILLFVVLAVSANYGPEAALAIPGVIIALFGIVRYFMWQKLLRKIKKPVSGFGNSEHVLRMNRLLQARRMRPIATRRLENRSVEVEPRSEPQSPELLWARGTPFPQKIGILIMLLLCAGVILPYAVYPGFVVHPGVAQLMIYISIILTVGLMVTIEYLHERELWRPKISFYETSASKHYLLVIPGIALFLWGILWINLAVAIPQAYTHMMGKHLTEQDLVVKELGSRRTFCPYKLQPRSIDSFGFQYCIAGDEFDRLPAGEMTATLHLRRSAVGYIVEFIDIEGY
jgi:hypothetical protein